jgi:hypothetical protein
MGSLLGAAFRTQHQWMRQATLISLMQLLLFVYVYEWVIYPSFTETTSCQRAQEGMSAWDLQHRVLDCSDKAGWQKQKNRDDWSFGFRRVHVTYNTYLPSHTHMLMRYSSEVTWIGLNEDSLQPPTTSGNVEKPSRKKNFASCQVILKFSLRPLGLTLKKKPEKKPMRPAIIATWIDSGLRHWMHCRLLLARAMTVHL